MSPRGIKSTPNPLPTDATGLAVRASAWSLVRQGQERLQAAVEGTEQDLEEVVHQTRVDMKRLRALWYLIRSGLPGQEVGRLQNACRELAQELGGSRDQQVMRATLASLTRDLPAEVVERLASALCTGAVTVEGGLLRRTLERYGQLEQLLGEVTWAGLKRVHVQDGLAWSFGKGKRCYRRACRGDEAEALHRWRKWVKVLQYQLEWLDLSPGWGLVLKPLGSALGDVHDLDVLAIQIRRTDISGDDLGLLEPLLVQRRQKMAGEALALGCDVYASKSPARRCRRLFQRWSAAG